MRGRHQHIEQGHDVLHLGRFAQIGFFGLLGRNVQSAQLVLHHSEPVTFAREHHDVYRLASIPDLLRQPVCSLTAFQRAQGVLGQLLGRGKAVAPALRRRVLRSCALRGGDGALNRRQAQHSSCVNRFCGVDTKTLEFTLRLRLPHHPVHQLHDRFGIAPRVVATQAFAA